LVEISIADPEDTNGIRDVQYKSLLAIKSEELGSIVDGVDKMDPTYSRGETLSKKEESKLKNDIRTLGKNLPRESETFVAKVNQKVIGFCTVVRGSEQNSLAEIYVIPAFQRKKIGQRLWDTARQFIDQNKDTTVALLRFNTPAKKFYEGLGFAETGVSWEGESLTNGNGTTVIEMILRCVRVP
jgi:ribosomal protein S18 acetylase RimI-like enzyme